MRSILSILPLKAKIAVFLLSVIPTAFFAQENRVFEGSIYRIEYSRSDPTDALTNKYDTFCLERPGFKVEVPWDAVEIFKGPEFTVRLYDMGLVECPHGWDLHLMGNRSTTGLWTSDMAAVYRLFPKEGENYYVTVWFTGLNASIHVDGKRTYIRTRVHHAYCDGDVGDECWIEMDLPS